MNVAALCNGIDARAAAPNFKQLSVQIAQWDVTEFFLVFKWKFLWVLECFVQCFIIKSWVLLLHVNERFYNENR